MTIIGGVSGVAMYMTVKRDVSGVRSPLHHAPVA